LAQAWFIVGILCLLGAVGLFARAVRYRLDDAAAIGILLILGFFFRPTRLDFQHGQFNIPLLMVLAAAYLADSRDRPYRTAAWLAAAALLQTWTVGLLLYPLARRNFLAFLWGVVLFCGVGAFLLASTNWKNPVTAIQQGIRLSPMTLPQGYDNQSIAGFARVHFGSNPQAEPWIDEPILLNGTIALGFVLLIGGLCFGFAHAPSASCQNARLQLGLFIVSLLLALPVCQRSYFILLVPVLWTLLASEQMSAAVRAASLAVYAIFTASFAAPAEPIGGWETLMPSAYFLAGCALWLTLLVAISRCGKDPTAPHTL
jgi:hypothetical protein